MRFKFLGLFALAISVTVFANLSAQQPVVMRGPHKSIQQEDLEKAIKLPRLLQEESLTQLKERAKKFADENPEMAQVIIRQAKENLELREFLAQAKADEKPKDEEVHGRGLIVPANLKERIAASWAKHGKKLKSLPTVTATSFDCRAMGWVPPADNQGGCGSCHIFSGADPCAAALYKAGKLKSPQTLSKQMVIDCSQRGACGGGWPEDTIDYVKSHGLATDDDYGVKYHAGPGTCKNVDSSKLLKVLESGYVAQDGGDGMPTYQQMKDAMVRFGVLSICYDADNTPVGPPSTSKVWKGSGGRSINHAIKCVAFDDTLSAKGAILCWNQWYGDDRDFWWAEWGANGLGNATMWVDAGDAPAPVPPIPPNPDGAPVITSATTATAQINQGFTFQITTAPPALAILVDPLPVGVAFNPRTGTISGTPTVNGVTTANIQAIGEHGIGRATLTITVTDKPVPPPPPDGGFTGSVTYTYKGGVLVSVTTGTSGIVALEADLKNAGISPAIIADVITFIVHLQQKQPYSVLIQDIMKIVADLVMSEPPQKMPKGKVMWDFKNYSDSIWGRMATAF